MSFTVPDLAELTEYSRNSIAWQLSVEGMDTGAEKE